MLFKYQPTNLYPVLVGFVGFTAFLSFSIICFDIALPPLLLNVTVYFDGTTSTFSHLAISIILLVTFVLKSYALLFKYQPTNLYPVLVGFVGFTAFLSFSIICFDIALPPLLLNVTVYFDGTTSTFSHLAISVILLVTFVLKLYALLFKYHPTNLYPFFVGFVGFTIVLFSSII